MPDLTNTRVLLIKPIFIAAAVFVLILTACTQPGPKTSESLPVYGFQVVKTFPHDRTAFTQGLVFHDGLLFEGTGLHGSSSLRKIDLETGEVLKSPPLPNEYF